jgi:hypothetical protein
MTLTMAVHCQTQNAFRDGEIMDGNVCLRCCRMDKDQSIRQAPKHRATTQIGKTAHTFLPAIGDFKGLIATYQTCGGFRVKGAELYVPIMNALFEQTCVMVGRYLRGSVWILSIFLSGCLQWRFGSVIVEKSSIVLFIESVNNFDVFFPLDTNPLQ